MARNVAAALVALVLAACVHSPAVPVNPGACDAAATIAERSACTLAQVQELEALLEAEESRMLLALERFAAQGAVDTGTGRTLPEEFRRAQLGWREYRDAECSYAYATAFGGSLRGLNAATCLRALLQQRIERVRLAHDALQTQSGDAGATP